MSSNEVTQCEERLVRVLRESSLAKLFISALTNAGCDITPHRHFVCENCSQAVDGGYDAKYNQIVICANKCKSDQKVKQILHHELVHMYDQCVVKLDLANDIQHLACTEVRAANLIHCKFGFGQGRILLPTLLTFSTFI